MGVDGGRSFLKLAESPFYAAGGGQVADVGTIECADGDCRARVQDVFRLGDDQALAVVLERGELRPGERVLARVDHAARHATEATTPRPTCSRPRCAQRLGGHVRQAGSYVGPDKLRFDFSHGQALSAEELRDVEDQVNEWIARNDPVRPITTTLDEAKRLGAMALFGEKYGEIVRMVEIGEGEYSRELCGGTHVRSTAEIGLFRILSETSSAANVRRIEAVTGPAAVELLREHDRLLGEIARTLRTTPGQALETVQARERARKELEQQLKRGGDSQAADAQVDLAALVATASEVAGARVLTAGVEGLDAKALLELARSPQGAARRGGDRARERGRGQGRAGRERRAGARGAGREGRRGRQVGRRGRRRGRRRSRHARPGGRARPEQAGGGARGRARADRGRARRLMRVLALDYGSARCGCALSDPTGTIVTPIELVPRPATRRGLARLEELVREREVERVVVGLPLSLSGEDTEQTRETRAFAQALSLRLGEGVPVEMHDERFTTRMAQRDDARSKADEDSRAAAHLLESWLAARSR